MIQAEAVMTYEPGRILHLVGCQCVLHGQPEPIEVARKMSDGARRVLIELIALCPGDLDTTGVSKFVGDRQTINGHLATLAKLGLVAKHEAQERLGIYPTALGRSVRALLPY